MIKLQATEEGRKNDHTQLVKVKEQYTIINRQYEFYKDLCENLQFRQNEELNSLNYNVKTLNENEKDLKFRAEQLENENKELS